MRSSLGKLLMASVISCAVYDCSGASIPESCERLRWKRLSVVSTTVAVRAARR